MAATIKGVTSLIFGCDSITTVIMQSTDSEISTEIVYAADEDGKYVALAIPEGGKIEVSGEYLYKGADIVSAMATSVSLTNGSDDAGAVFVYSYGRKATNNGFMTGSFKAGGVVGVTS